MGYSEELMYHSFKVITEKFATTDLNIRDEKEAQIKAIKAANKPLLDDEIIREEQYKGVRKLLDLYLTSSSERNKAENFTKQWAKLLGISEPDWKEKKKQLEQEIKGRLTNYLVETEFNTKGVNGGYFRGGTKIWQGFLNTVDQDGEGQTGFAEIKRVILNLLAEVILDYLLARTDLTNDKKWEAIEEYRKVAVDPSEKGIFNVPEYKTKIEALKPSSLWPNETTDKAKAIKRVETLMKTDSSGRYVVSDAQLDIELALP